MLTFPRRAALFSGIALGLLISSGAEQAQQAQEPRPQQAAEGNGTSQPGSAQHQGMATGTARGAQFDDQHRPITAGGTVKTGTDRLSGCRCAGGFNVVAQHHWDAPEAFDHRGQGLGRVPDRLRSRRVARHLPGERVDLRRRNPERPRRRMQRSSAITMTGRFRM